MRTVLSALLIFYISCVHAQTTTTIRADACYSDKRDKVFWHEMKSNDFTADPSKVPALVNALRFCLADPDPVIRDEVAYSALSKWMREDALPLDVLSKLYRDLTSDIHNMRNDDKGVYLPFAVLVFSEVVRVDRVKPYLTDEQRQHAVDATVQLLKRIDDFRGFDDRIGWRHQVAHTSDVVLQLGLNQAVTRKDLILLMEALTEVVSPAEHAYIHGESERLARAVGYTMLREEVSIDFWHQWLEEIGSSLPFDAWDEVYKSEKGLTKRHNTRLFLMSLHSLISGSDNKRLSVLSEVVSAQLKRSA